MNRMINKKNKQKLRQMRTKNQVFKIKIIIHNRIHSNLISAITTLQIIQKMINNRKVLEKHLKCAINL